MTIVIFIVFFAKDGRGLYVTNQFRTIEPQQSGVIRSTGERTFF